MVPSTDFFRMKLITPAIASEPYTAEALPVRISTRSIIPSGRLPMSVKLLRLLSGSGKSAIRRPLTSTSVWLGPRPRRSTAWAPGVDWALVVFCWPCTLPLFWLSERSRSGTEVRPAAWICSEDTTVIGAGPSTCARGMREPVTWTASRLVTGASAAACAGRACGAGRAGAAGLAAAPFGTINIAPEASRWARKPLPLSSASSDCGDAACPLRPALRAPLSWSARYTSWVPVCRA